MPRKKTEPITGVSADPKNKLTVQKSNPLSVLWRSDLTLPEFKILDAYLARIDSHNPDKRAVRFQKGEIERLLGVKKINVSELKERVQHLMTPLIIDESPRSFRGIVLFEEACCEADKNGVWQVDLECTQKAMKYIFNVERIGYYRYKLRCVSSLSSRYSYILFLYLEQNRYRKSWEVSVDELKRLLNCENEESYKPFKVFNDRILKRCQAELRQKSECRFSYDTVKAGRNVIAIHITLETLSDQILPPPQEPIQGSLFAAADEYADDRIGMAQEAFEGLLTREETEAILLLGAPLITTSGHGPECDAAIFAASLYARYKVYACRNPVKSPYAYLRKMVAQDLKQDLKKETAV